MMSEVGLSYYKVAIFQLIIKYLLVEIFCFRAQFYFLNFLVTLVSSSIEVCSFFKVSNFAVLLIFRNNPFQIVLITFFDSLSNFVQSQTYGLV